LIHSKCKDLEIRKALTQNLYEEEVEDIPHSSLWVQFEESIGVPSSQTRNADLLNETATTIFNLKSICSDRSVEEGIASMFAYEFMLPQVSKRKIEGLKTHYGISDPKSLAFFTTHLDADVKHSAIWLQLLENNKNIEEFKLKKAVKDTCDALNLFLDGIMKNYVDPVC